MRTPLPKILRHFGGGFLLGQKEWNSSQCAGTISDVIVRTVSELESHNVHRNRLLIVGFKLVTGGAEFVSGTIFLLLSAAGLQRIADAMIAEELREDPGDLFALLIQHRLPTLLQNKTAIAVALFFLGTVKIIGAVGFLLHRSWGFYLLTALLTVLLPADIYHLFFHPTALAAVIVFLNIMIVGYMILNRKFLLAK